MKQAQSLKLKVQNCNPNLKIKVTNLKLLVLNLSFTLYALSFTLYCYAQEVTVLYTGDTHAMIYPCNCPREPYGGVARRATLINQLRRENPATLLLDSGGFFASGLLDEYSQNTDLDMLRSLINLQAMELMQYDAVTIGSDEFNFGRQFLEKNISQNKIAFLCANIKSDKFLPYIIKEVGGFKFGIIGATTPSVKPKVDGLEIMEPRIAVRQAVAQVKEKGAIFVLLLSHLGETEDTKLIQEVEGIDIIISGHGRSKDGPLTKIGPTLLARPSWQGKSLGKLSLQISDNRITHYKVEELRLSESVGSDPEILSILPDCFSDTDCRKEGFVGVCQEPGRASSRCVFSASARVNLLVVLPKKCIFCETDSFIKYLKSQFPGLTASYLYYPDDKTKALVHTLNIKTLPAFILGEEIEREKGFGYLKDKLERKADSYLIKPEFSGMGYFINRQRINGKLDLFLSLYDKNTPQLLEAIKDFHPRVHFLVILRDDKFQAQNGPQEVEESLRALCVQKYYPQQFWNYLNCRAVHINSSWWEDCLGLADQDTIKACAKGDQGASLLRENISLNKELQVMFGPTYLVDNQEVFGSTIVPNKEEFKKLFRKR